ncbi:periplasmic repressor CpxP [Marinomonas aquimarina]|uniref:Periplasmic repressor CpxP n=1 Tax=Marinomonas aquimarina TaxID=295068 RepID=A0A1A8T2K3_9GAMM|nr:Spy/CpxP family protein refolding chaperone [Marinomonas aquimarina]SBS25197.1 periplasmic repressor CpxP [Marinomonas aquimarina]
MNLSKKLIVAAIALPLFAGSAFADGDRSGKGRHHQERHTCASEAGAFQQLSLSEAQQAELKKLRKSHREQMMQQREQHKERMSAHQAEKNERVKKILLAPTFDSNAAQQLADDAAAMLASMTVKKLAFEHELVSVLTAEQKQQYISLKQDHKKGRCDSKRGHDKRMHGKHHGESEPNA